jgi:hypothetical protein
MRLRTAQTRDRSDSARRPRRPPAFRTQAAFEPVCAESACSDGKEGGGRADCKEKSIHGYRGEEEKEGLWDAPRRCGLADSRNSR